MHSEHSWKARISTSSLRAAALRSRAPDVVPGGRDLERAPHEPRGIATGVFLSGPVFHLCSLAKSATARFKKSRSFFTVSSSARSADRVVPRLCAWRAWRSSPRQRYNGLSAIRGDLGHGTLQISHQAHGLGLEFFLRYIYVVWLPIRFLTWAPPISVLSTFVRCLWNRGRFKSTNSSLREPFANASMSYESLNKFLVIVKDQSGEGGRFILRRHGIDWKLTEIAIPLDK